MTAIPRKLRTFTATATTGGETQGSAAHFVSGFVYEPDRTHGSELHARAVIYLLGGGWRGYVPTLEIAVADSHIPAGPEPELAAPTQGYYVGNDDSQIDYHVHVVRVASNTEPTSDPQSGV